MADVVLRSFPEAIDSFKERSDAHSGLDFAYGAGRVCDDGTVTDTAAGTVTLADDDTNYIEVDVTDGTVSDNTTGFSGGDQWPLYTAVTSSGSITTVTDKRAYAMRTSGGGATGILTTKGDLLSYGSAEARLAVGSNDQVLTADSGETTGLKWAAAPGTAVDQLTTKGDVLVHTGAAYARVGVGSNNQVIIADSAEANGVKWSSNIHGANLKDYEETCDTETSPGAAYTIDLENGNVHDVTMDDDTTFTFSNPPASGTAGSFTLILRQDANGSRTPTWPASVDWPSATEPTWSTGANDVDVVTFLTVDAGTTWLGFLAGADLS